MSKVTNAMAQSAPWPHHLEYLVDHLELPLHPKWVVVLQEIDRGQGSLGLTLDIRTHGRDSYHPENENYGVHHYFIVPAASYNRQSWQRWLFDRLMDVELHEMMEGYVIDGHRPYAPNHGPGHDPYTVRELTTDEDRRTSFRGVVKGE